MCMDGISEYLRIGKRGFTLIEILVATAIVAILALVIVQVFITTVRVNTKTEIMKEIKQNGDYATSILTRLVQNAQDIDDCTVFPHQLTITNPDASQTVIEALPVHDAANSRDVCRISSTTSGVTDYLTSMKTTLAEDITQCSDGITFQCVLLYGNVSRVMVHFTLIQPQTASGILNFEKARMEFGTSVTVRNIPL